MTQKELIKKSKEEVANIKDRREQIKQLIPKYIISTTLTKSIYSGNTTNLNNAIRQLKFEFLEDQYKNTPKKTKQKNIDNYLEWLKELNQNEENTEIIIKILNN